jgi:outer membrane biosynthesis protein TonB
MPTAAGPRFVLEAGFLVLLAVVVGLADLDPLLIVLVMLFAWRQTQSALMRGFEPALAGIGVSEMAAGEAPPPLPPPPPPTPPPDEDTIVEPPAAEEENVDEPKEEASAEEPPAHEEPGAPAEDSGAIALATAAEERRIAHTLEPLKPRPRRRWLFFGPRGGREEPAEDDNEA